MTTIRDEINMYADCLRNPISREDHSIVISEPNKSDLEEEG